MFDRFTDRAKKIMSLSREAAVQLGHEYIGTEHLLLGLVREGTGVAAKVLQKMGLELDGIDRAVGDVLESSSRKLDDAVLPFTPQSKKVLELSMEEASGFSHDYVGSEHLLLGLLAQGDGVAAQVLQNAGASLDRARAGVRAFLGIAPNEP